MNRKLLKSAVGVLLAVIMALSLPFSVIAAGTIYYPVVYVAGASDSALYENPNKTQSSVKFGLNDSAFISSCVNMLSTLLVGEGTAMFTSVNKEVNNIFSEIACKADGTSLNPNISVWNYNMPIMTYNPEDITDIDTANFSAIIENSAGRYSEESIYVYTCDWRLDPIETAGGLKEYIDTVLAYADAGKVTLLCGGFGGTVASAYLSEYEQHAVETVDSITFLDATLLGDANIGDLMSGHLYRTAGDATSLTGLIDTVDGQERGTAFTNYFGDDPNAIFSSIFQSLLGEGAFSELISMFIKILIQSILNNESIDRDLGMAYNKFLINNEEKLYSGSLGKYIRNMPGLWALVPEEDYDRAIDNLFGDEIINDILFDKITSYRSIMKNVDYTLANAKLKGIMVNVVCGYGIQNLPLTASINAESDGTVSTRTASAGATTLECPVDWTGYDRCTNLYHDHFDPNKDIDASTCALPENTWFIKDMPHLEFSCATAATFLVWLLTASSQKTVWDNNFYTQYMKYNKYSNAITAFTNTTENDTFTYGDYNFDGVVDIQDARKVLRVSIGLEEKPSKYTLVVGDVNADGYISIEDARLILRYAIGLDRFFDAVQ